MNSRLCLGRRLAFHGRKYLKPVSISRDIEHRAAARPPGMAAFRWAEISGDGGRWAPGIGAPEGGFPFFPTACTTRWARGSLPLRTPRGAERRNLLRSSARIPLALRRRSGASLKKGSCCVVPAHHSLETWGRWAGRDESMKVGILKALVLPRPSTGTLTAGDMPGALSLWHGLGEGEPGRGLTTGTNGRENDRKRGRGPFLELPKSGGGLLPNTGGGRAGGFGYSGSVLNKYRCR
jgi:hypothetical protein